jgi:trehalose/maltose hydrolase-like predicted phosphorylase
MGYKELYTNLEKEVGEFLTTLFNKYDIEINEDLQDDYPIEHELYSLIENLEEYVKFIEKYHKEVEE